ncbi:MAG: hypothetical protein KY475_02155 [Planctomycetes bacterium]|nr:hypothetical protein [Planctomycetota bacterium]
MANSASSSGSGDKPVARQGVGLGMDMAFSPPPDPTGWRQCPDCQIWCKDENRPSCPNCGYVFGQEDSSVPVPALDEATLRAAQELIDTAGGVENARIALRRAAQERS